jgi:hypothetical protein
MAKLLHVSRHAKDENMMKKFHDGALWRRYSSSHSDERGKYKILSAKLVKTAREPPPFVFGTGTLDGSHQNQTPMNSFADGSVADVRRVGLPRCSGHS